MDYGRGYGGKDPRLAPGLARTAGGGGAGGYVYPKVYEPPALFWERGPAGTERQAPPGGLPDQADQSGAVRVKARQVTLKA